jgi:hypothetical protein
MSGNPVRIGDGCATVTGYKPPPSHWSQDWEGGGKVKTRSQDIGLAALVVGVVVERAVACLAIISDFSVKEKDETRLLNCFQWTR